jgi:hypothetical protein
MLRIYTTKISSVAQGGEPLHEVMGQEEDHEYLRYQRADAGVTGITGANAGVGMIGTSASVEAACNSG